MSLSLLTIWYLVNKNTLGKYWLVIIIIKLNQVIVWDTNLLLSTYDFSENFADYIIFSFIDFFSGYDQVELAGKS